MGIHLFGKNRTKVWFLCLKCIKLIISLIFLFDYDAVLWILAQTQTKVKLKCAILKNKNG